MHRPGRFVFRILSGFLGNAFGEAFGKIPHEGTVVKVESLNRGGRAAAVGGGNPPSGQSRLRKRSPAPCGSHGVDHAAHILGLEVVLGDPVAGVVGVRHERRSQARTFSGRVLRPTKARCRGLLRPPTVWEGGRRSSLPASFAKPSLRGREACR